jgi:PIN domain nuclease of toxin-antitoxin system
MPDDFPEVVRQSGFSILQLADIEAATFHRLPRTKHKDPFDRLIIWQSISRKMTLISRDRAITDYQKAWAEGDLVNRSIWSGRDS